MVTQTQSLLLNFFPHASAPPPTPSTPSFSSSPLANTSKSTPSVPIKRLSLEKLTLRYERGLCFNCNEKYHCGHKCASKVFLLIADDDEGGLASDPNIDPLPKPPDGCNPTQTQISLYSFSGHLAPETLRLLGCIADHQVVILVDGGSTHNFIQEHLAHQLGLPTQTTTPLNVMVGNGHHLDCRHVCATLAVHIKDIVFNIDLHVLPLCGAHIVLDVQWLKSLGSVLTDYNDLSMKFSRDGRVIEFKGDIASNLSLLTPPQLRRLVHKSGASALFHIRILSTELPSNQASPTQLLSGIQTLITKFNSPFQQPTTLPPSRPTNHHIHLFPNSNPVNVRPYRYPYFQKQEIEAQVYSMLQRGVIRPSTSLFSSPVLLVKKHDGTWRFFVDYQALNAITIKDHFPILTIDELLDELGGSQWFTKLDLLQGYHQILMHEDDIIKTAFKTYHGHYEFTVMPFGLCNAPSSFQATMNSLFRPYLRRFIIVFFDDILIYSSSFNDHFLHLELAFQVLLQGQFFIKLSKCSFAQTQVEYLGHVVSNKGVEPVQQEIQAIQQWPIPRSSRGLCGFWDLLASIADSFGATP